MFFKYILDRLSWILFFVLSLLFTNILIWLDKGLSIQISSMLYMNGLLAISFLVFLLWRYAKETAYSRSLAELAQNTWGDWHEALPEPQFNHEQTIDDLLKRVVQAYQRSVAELQASTLRESEYTAAWVHEVKAPLTAMKLIIDANRQDSAIRNIEAEWLRVHLLIDRQLYISRLPTLSSDYLLENIDVHDLVAPEVREMRSWCMEKNLAVEFEGEGIEVITDKKWCRFIIRQLVTNAVKYSPVGGTILISVEGMRNGQVQMTIRDEGPGIPAHELPRIFDKGFTGGTGRLHNAATGLGLYLARQVAEKIGISLAVQSELDQFTVLQMTFSTENDFDATRT